MKKRLNAEIDSLETVRKQHRQLDETRQTHLLDVNKVQKEVSQLVNLREKDSKTTVDDLREFSKDLFPLLHEKFPKFLEIALNYEKHRMQEFKEIIGSILKNLERVQKKEMTQEECSFNILEKDLPSRFMRKK